MASSAIGGFLEDAMGCLVIALALLGISPRVLIFGIWLFTDFFSKSFESVFLPLLGFLFLPWTTLWCAFVWHNGGTFSLFEIIILIVCVATDVGSGSAAASNATPVTE